MHSFTLNPSEIHIWNFAIKHEILWEILSPDEKKRALQFYFEKDLIAYAFSRSHLRLMLSQYLDIKPKEITFHYTEYGKPFLAPSQNINHIQFNLSHTHNRVVYAVTLNDELGIDMEYVKKDIDYEAIAKHFFSDYEQALIQNASSLEKSYLFYRIWTSKEAFIKAMGLGLSFSLKDFDVGNFSENSAHILRINNDQERAKKWSLFCLNPIEDYIAALAIKSKGNLILYQN